MTPLSVPFTLLYLPTLDRAPRGTGPAPVKHAGAAAAWGAAREIAPVPQILARSADMAGDVRTRTNVTVLALVTERPFRIFARNPGRETLVADAFVHQSVCDGRHLRVPTAAGAAGSTARAAVPARASGAAFTGDQAVAGAVFFAGLWTLRGRTVAFGLVAGQRLLGLRGLQRDRGYHFALRDGRAVL